jgi:hypothetical protein
MRHFQTNNHFVLISWICTFSKSISIPGPEKDNLMKQPWFLGLLISIIGVTLWFALCIFVVWLCRKRKAMKKQKMQEMYSGKDVYLSECAIDNLSVKLHVTFQVCIHQNSEMKCDWNEMWLDLILAMKWYAIQLDEHNCTYINIENGPKLSLLQKFW